MRQLTNFEVHNSKLNSEYGEISYRDWLELEKKRINNGKCEVLIKTDSLTEEIALFEVSCKCPKI